MPAQPMQSQSMIVNECQLINHGSKLLISFDSLKDSDPATILFSASYLKIELEVLTREVLSENFKTPSSAKQNRIWFINKLSFCNLMQPKMYLWTVTTELLNRFLTQLAQHKMSKLAIKHSTMTSSCKKQRKRKKRWKGRLNDSAHKLNDKI